MDDVLNWLLQGGLVAVAAAAALRVIGPHRARPRYVVLWVAQLSIVMLPVIPLAWSATFGSSENATAMLTPAPVVALPSAWWTSLAVPVGLWALWGCVCLGRIAFAAFALRRARRTCRSFSADLESRLACWMSVRTRGRRVPLLVSDAVRSAAVIGYWPPAIVVAPRMLERLDTEDLDRIVIHEWAHIERRDHLAHLLQLSVGIVAGWHPAAWWVDRQLHLEREVACDELAVSVTGSAREYAACLVRLASLPVHVIELLPSLAATSNLRRRITRIVAPNGSPRRLRRTVAFGAGAAICVTAAVVGGVRFVDIEAARHVVGAAMAHAAPPLRDAAAAPAEPTNTVARATPRPPAAAQSRRAPEVPDAAPDRTWGPPLRLARPEPVEGRARSGQALAGPEVANRTGRPPSRLRFASAWHAVARSAEAAGGPEVAISDTTDAQPLPATTVGSPHVLTAVGGAVPSPAQPPTHSPWSAAADAGVSIGDASQKAAVATAGFFTRFGKRVARSF